MSKDLIRRVRALESGFQLTEAQIQELENRPVPSGTSVIPLSNTVWINQDLSASDTTNRVFKTYDEAITWIQANGEPAADNLWQVNLPAGDVGIITLNSSIRVVATDGTYIEKLKSNQLFASFTDMFDAYISGAVIGTIEIDDGQGLALYNCVVKNVTPATTMGIYFANNTQFLGGDFENLVGFSYYSLYQDLEGDISNLTVNGQHTDISHTPDSPYSINVGDVDLRFGQLSPSTIIGDRIDLEFCKLSNNITLSSGVKATLKNCEIDDTLTLLSGSTLYAFNTNFTSSILCKTTTCYINNSHIDTLRVDEGGGCSVNSGSIIDCYVEDSSTLFLKNVHCYYPRIADTSIFNTKGCNFDFKDIAGTATWNNEGDAYDNSNSGLVAKETNAAIDELKSLIDTTGATDCTSVTYAELQALVTASSLEVGKRYLITDFAQSYNIFDGGTMNIEEEHIGADEPIIVTASKVNELHKVAISTVYPQDIIHYSLDILDIRDIAFSNGVDTVNANFKGMIYYRKDTVQNVETHYDFRNVKFRRWAVDAVAFDNGTAYVANDVCKSVDGKIYKCITATTGEGDPTVNTADWVLWLDITADAFVSWTSDKTKFNIGGDINTDNLIINNVTAGVDYDDFYTFGNYYKWVKNVSIGMIDLEYAILYGSYTTQLNNIVCKTIDEFYTCFGNNIGSNCWNNTIGNGFYSNTIGDFFYTNTIGDGFISNTIGDFFNTNTIGNFFRDNAIGNRFISNTIGDDFNSNTIGNDFRSNTIGNGFYSNTIGDDFNSNTIGNYFYSNTIGNNFYNTIFGYDCRYNTIANKINGTADSKIITFGDNITMCTIQDYAFGVLAADLDLTAATHIRGAYNTTIYQDKTNGVKLSYMDAGVMIIDDVTD